MSINTVLVSGGGSVWNNGALIIGRAGTGNQFTIANGGAVVSGFGAIGVQAHSSNNEALVSGSGSVWTDSGELSVGFDGAANRLAITNGGLVYSHDGIIGVNSGSDKNMAVVTGTGSVWNATSVMIVGMNGASNQLSILNGAVVSDNNGTIGYNAANNTVLVSGIGSVWSNTGTLWVGDNGSQGNHLVISNGGLVSASTVIAQPNNSITLNNGLLIAGNSLLISSNSIIRGIGTVVGAVTVNGGGVLAPGASPGSITFSNNLTLAPNSVFAVELIGNGGGQHDQIVTLGTVSVSNSVLSLTLGYAPALGDAFTIISNLGPNTVFGTFIDPQGDVLTNNATFIAGSTTFQINYAGDASGQDVVLTAVVPEPSTCFLVALGVAGVFGLSRRLALRR
jgi:T5SS/PEP-CTERM-associated repeat protein